MNKPTYKCERKDCLKSATKIPVLSFKAKGYPNSPRSQIVLDLHVCDEHAVPDKDLFISEAAWHVIGEEMAKRGLVEPDWESVDVDFMSTDYLRGQASSMQTNGRSN